MEDSFNACGISKKGKSNVVHYEAFEQNPTKWTDEKHTMYLKTMESLFVDQLHKSLDLSVDKNQHMGSSFNSKHRNQRYKLMIQSESEGEFSTTNAKAPPPFSLFTCQIYPQNEYRFGYQASIHGYGEMMDQNF